MGGFLFSFVFIQHEVTGISPASLFIAKHRHSPWSFSRIVHLFFVLCSFHFPWFWASVLLGVGKQEEGKQKCFAFLWGQGIVSQLLRSLPWQLGRQQLLLNIAERIAGRLWQSGGAFFTQVRCWWVRCICWVITKCHSCRVPLPGNASLAGTKQRLGEFRSFLTGGSDRSSWAVQIALRLPLLPQLWQPLRSLHSTLLWTVVCSHKMRTEVFILK